MANAVATSSPVSAAYGDEVDRQLAQATRRIRFQDLFFGALLLALVTLGYLATMITLDRLMEMPGWARQIAFVGLLAVLGWIAYRWIFRPLQRRLNPLYAAKQIEATVDNAKNSIVNWVDLRDRNLPDSIQKMLGVRAARQLKDADLDRAGESRKLIWAGTAVAAMVTVLAILFLVFRPAVFGSLVGRAMNPFGSVRDRKSVV